MGQPEKGFHQCDSVSRNELALSVPWREAAELAADDSAVTNRQEALALAAALIKLSRFSRAMGRACACDWAC